MTKHYEGKRDNALNGRIMEVSTFPTATMVLTQPIDFEFVLIFDRA